MVGENAKFHLLTVVPVLGLAFTLNPHEDPFKVVYAAPFYE